MPPARPRVAVVMAVLGVAIFSATPALRWCSAGWADVRPECFVPPVGMVCGADKGEGAGACCAGASAACEGRNEDVPTGSDAATASSDAPAEPQREGPRPGVAPVPNAGAQPKTRPESEPTDEPREPDTVPPAKRAYCPDGSCGGDGTPGPRLDEPDPPAAAAAAKAPVKKTDSFIAPELWPITVHRVRPPQITPARTTARADEQPATPRAPPRNIHLFGWF